MCSLQWGRNIREHLGHLDKDKSKESDRMHVRVRKDMAKVTVRLFGIFERSWQSVTDDWKKANIMPIFKEGEKEGLEMYRTVQLLA